MSMKQVIVIRRDLEMSRGKEIAQGAHASLGAYHDTLDRVGPVGLDYLEEWQEGGNKKVVCAVSSREELLRLVDLAERHNVGHYLVKDRGGTELQPDTPTALGLGPDLNSIVDRVSGDLELYRGSDVQEEH